MYREDYSVVIPKFKEVKVSIDELGAVSGKLDVKTGHDNAVIINNAIRSLSENGWNMGMCTYKIIVWNQSSP